MALRLATFNLKDFFSARTEHERGVVEAKLANVAASLRRAAADIVALQEVGSLDLLDRLVKALPELGYGEPVAGPEDRRGIRNVILSRLPVLWSQVHQARSLPFPRFVEGDPEPFPNRIPLRRGIVHLRVEAGSLGEVDVLTAHFKSNLPAQLKTQEGAEVPDVGAHAIGESAVRSLVQRAARPRPSPSPRRLRRSRGLPRPPTEARSPAHRASACSQLLRAPLPGRSYAAPPFVRCESSPQR